MSFSRRTLLAAIAVLAAPAIAFGQDFPQPQVTDAHKVLRKDVGVWKAEMKIYTAPGADPIKSSGTERNRLIGGLWLISNFTGDFEGQKFNGHGQFGYDIDKKKYIGTWVDSMSNHMSMMEGTYDEKTQTLTMTGEMAEPDGTKVKTKNVTKYEGKDKRIMKMYMQTPDGQWVESMEIVYTRIPLPNQKKKKQ